MKRSRVSRWLACFLANIVAIVVFSQTAVAEPNLPPEVSQLQGPSQGLISEELTFSAIAVDPENDPVCVIFDWGEGQVSGWSKYQPSGSVFEASYAWFSGPGTYHIMALAKDSFGNVGIWSDSIMVVISPNLSPEPPEVSQLQGPSQGQVNEVLTFSVIAVDPENDSVCVRFAWDNWDSQWSEYQPSGSVFEMSRSWLFPGTYHIMAQARDSFGNIGSWCHEIVVDITVVVGIDSDSETPQTFVLSQNYPNPFNPATEISFSLPEDSYVTLTVFNAVGQKVETLAEGTREAGSYQVRWDGDGFPSGVYFYRLETQGFTKTIKMLLMK